jgi:hypothetical protein
MSTSSLLEHSGAYYHAVLTLLSSQSVNPSRLCLTAGAGINAQPESCDNFLKSSIESASFQVGGHMALVQSEADVKRWKRTIAKVSVAPGDLAAFRDLPKKLKTATDLRRETKQKREKERFQKKG